MSHVLADLINQAQGFVLIGDSSQSRFPALSYHNYARVGKRFYCLDMGGLKESRGATKGGKVYQSVEELPESRGDLAIVWVKPRRAKAAVDLAHAAGCKRVWLSFQTAHPDALARAKEHGMEIVEIGRCPVHYLDGMSPACVAHTLLLRITGSYARPPQVDLNSKRRELW